METKFEIGDVVRCHDLKGTIGIDDCSEYTVARTNYYGVVQSVVLAEGGEYMSWRFTLVRRASAQREGGFVVGHRVMHTTFPAYLESIEPADRATARPDIPVQKIQECGCIEGTAHGCEPPQPAPMTRAARVLAGMMADPYLERPEVRDMVRVKANLRNEAARLRMAKMSLDRPLDAERARWERLVLAKVPTGRR